MDNHQQLPPARKPDGDNRTSMQTPGRPPASGRKQRRKSKSGPTSTPSSSSAPPTPPAAPGSPPSSSGSSPMLQPQLSSSYGSVSAGALPPVMRRNTVSDSGSNHPAPEIARRLEFERSVSSNNLTTSSPGAVDSPRSRPAGTAPPMATVFEREAQGSAFSSQPARQGSFITPQASSSSLAAAPSTAAAAAAAGLLPTAGGSVTGVAASSSSTTWPVPGFLQYLAAEAQPPEKYPTADVVWRQTERDRVYNYLLYVPYQLERVMTFGTCLCLWSYLGTFTLLPLRCFWALLTLASAPSARARTKAATYAPGGGRLLPGNQLYDLACVALLGASLWTLLLLPPGRIYYWMKDVISEFLRIQVLFTALELLDKILANFGMDVLEALSSSCTLYSRRTISALHLASDLLVAYAMITLHGAVLMCQAMVFAVAMNSKRHALLALLIASNFVEIKGTVNKRTDTTKLWTLVCLDIVERCHLLVVLAFVVVEDVSNSGGWAPAGATLWECGRIFVWEVVIDVVKHAVLGKFNDIRPGIHREYMRDLCQDALDRQSHNVHKLMGFFPLGPAVLGLRMLVTLITLRHGGSTHWAVRAVAVGALWLAACCWQVVLGYLLKLAAGSYVRYRDSQAGGKPQQRVVKPPVDRDAGSTRPGGSAGGAGVLGPPGASPAVGGGMAGASPGVGLVIPPFTAASVATPSPGPVQPSVASHLAAPATVGPAARTKWE